MSEFSDQPGFDSGTDFTDSVQDSPQTPEAPPSVSPTPEPEPDNVCSLFLSGDRYLSRRMPPDEG